MAKYYIPEAVQYGFENIIQLNQDQIGLIIGKMDQFAPGDSPEDFFELMDEVSVPNIDDIAKTIFSFSGLLLEHKGEVKELSQELFTTFISDYEGDFEVEDQERVILNITHIFEHSLILKGIYKLYNLSNEVARSFRKGSILTDIRVAFNDDLEKESRNAVVIQQLKLEFIENTERKELFLNLDRGDLISLKEQIERALRKEEIIVKDYNSMLNFVKIRD